MKMKKIKTRMENLHNLWDEAKRRTILWAIFISGIAYLMSLTSSSFWFNIPIATILLAVLRYLSFELEIRKRVQSLKFPSHLSHLLKQQISGDDPLLRSPPVSTRWRRKIESPVVEAAVDDLTCRVVQEFVTDLWYSSLTPDQDVPEQLRVLINDLFGEIAQRVKRINLVHLLTRDVVELVRNHLDLFREAKATIGAKIFGTLSSEEREEKLKQALLHKKQLHPALLSSEDECKVLQRLMSGVVATLLRPQDVQCPLMRCLARELLACAVILPIMNLASPGFINKTIEDAVISYKENGQNNKSERVEVDGSLSDRSSKGIMTQVSGSKDDLSSGLEIWATANASGQAPVRGGASRNLEVEQLDLSKNIVTSHRVPNVSSTQENHPAIHTKQGDWAQVLEAASQRRTRTLAPENLDNLWAKGRNYTKKELEKSSANSSQTTSQPGPRTKEVIQHPKIPLKDCSVKEGDLKAHELPQIGETARSLAIEPLDSSKTKKLLLEQPKLNKRSFLNSQTPVQSASFLGEATGSCALGFGSGEIKQIGPSVPRTTEVKVKRHPLESGLEDAVAKYQGEVMHESAGAAPHHRRSNSSNAGLDGWQKYAKSSIHQDNSRYYWDAAGVQKSSASSQFDQVTGWLSDTLEAGGQGTPGGAASSKLNCWVVGAHLEKSGSTSFAVYSIAVTDSDNKTWFVERRFRNFEQLHRHLRDLPQYDLHLPPKRFLSSSLDDTFVRDRCILLDKYLKDLLSIPSIAELHEVWDFLSVTSKNYAFGKSHSVIKTLAVNVDDAVDDMFRQIKGVSDGIVRRVSGPSSTSSDRVFTVTSGYIAKSATPPETTSNEISWEDRGTLGHFSDHEHGGLSGVAQQSSTQFVKDEGWHSDSDLQLERHFSETIPGFSAQNRKSETDNTDQYLEGKIYRLGSDPLWPEESMAGSDIFDEELAVPPEWIPPKLTVPLLNLVDDVFQLQRRGWIRRQVFWMAKQILQLGMGDAIDDWLVGQIQWLRREDVVASAVRWVQEILWPCGIFISKVSTNDQTTSLESTSGRLDSQVAQKGTDQSAFFELHLEASRRASVVHEIIVDGAPAALVSLIGKKQYTKCSKDIYCFLQSTVCLKQLAYSLLESLITATFPELKALVLDVRLECIRSNKVLTGSGS